MGDHMSKIKNGELPMGLNDELPNTILFKVDFAPDYYDGIVEYLMSGRPPLEMSKVEAKKLIRKAGPYQFTVG